MELPDTSVHTAGIAGGLFFYTPKVRIIVISNSTLYLITLSHMYVYIFLFVTWRQTHNFSLSDAIFSLHMTETYIDTMSFVLLSQSTKKFHT